ncbi:MAG: hypothetical protein JNM25_06970, partial [Planctomycetes bacterium]|nr:hypothetical protein [Planctomycetota bacterium]
MTIRPISVGAWSAQWHESGDDGAAPHVAAPLPAPRHSAMTTKHPDPSSPEPTAEAMNTPPPIRLHAKEGLLGEGKIHRFEIPSAAGMTARKVMEVARGVPALSKRPLGVAVNGRRLEPAELDQQLPDGAEVMVASPQHGTELGALLVQALISAVIGVAINYLVSLLLPKPKPPGIPQDRGDDSSPTYTWDGIQTSYGQGQPVPFGYGRHAVGGQVIYSEVADYSSTPGLSGEYLRILLALCDGPIHRVGDLIAGEQNGLGLTTPLPATIKVNQLELLGSTQGVLAWIRAGNLNQTPIPPPFSGAAATLAVGYQLQAAYSEAFFAILGDEDISAVYVIVSFPNGLWEQDATGALTGAQWPWLLEWRSVGESTWRLLAQSAPGAYYYRPAGGILGIYGALPAGTLAPIELRLQRLGPTVIPSGQVSDLGVWRQVTAYSAHQFAYPGVAILGLELRADARLQGAQPQLQVTCDLLKVRVWDESLGWSEPCWDVPAAPFNWMQHPPGRNPAWQALHLLLDDVVGLGRWFKEADVDLEAARRWSIFCDTEPNPSDPWGEPSFTFDGVFDSPRPAWERLLAICAAGRCTPILLGRRISFVYQYRDAHSDSLVTVPAKAPVQLFTSTNIEGLSINWLPRRNRSTVIQYQFLNESKAYAQDVLPVEDPEGSANDTNNPRADTWQPEVTQLYGVTRESQLLREGVFTHRLQRLVTHEILFRTGPWALGAQVGDLILVENEVLRPFGADVPMSCAIEQAQTSHDKMIV